MKNRFLQWCINWWASEESPQWLRSASDGDPKLVKYEEELNSLSRLLREDASDWAEREVRATDSSEPPSQTVQLGKSKDARTRLATAIVLVGSLAAVILLWTDFVTFPAKRLPPNKQMVAVDARQLSEGLNSIMRVVDKSLTEMGDSVSIVPIFAGDAVEATSSDVKAICGTARTQFESVSRSYGRALALMEKSVRGQLGGIDTEAPEN